MSEDCIFGCHCVPKRQRLFCIPGTSKNNEDTSSTEEFFLDWSQERIVVSIEADGNCFFRCLSQCLYNCQNYHRCIRVSLVNFMKPDPSFMKFVTGDYKQHIHQMYQLGTWATDAEIWACADLLMCHIFVWGEHGDTEKWMKFSPKATTKVEDQFYISLVLRGNHFELVKPATWECNCLLPAPKLQEQSVIVETVHWLKQNSSIREDMWNMTEFVEGGGYEADSENDMDADDCSTCDWHFKEEIMEIVEAKKKQVLSYGKLCRISAGYFECLRCDYRAMLSDIDAFKQHLWQEIQETGQAALCLTSDMCSWATCPVLDTMLNTLVQQQRQLAEKHQVSCDAVQLEEVNEEARKLPISEKEKTVGEENLVENDAEMEDASEKQTSNIEGMSFTEQSNPGSDETFYWKNNLVESEVEMKDLSEKQITSAEESYFFCNSNCFFSETSFECLKDHIVNNHNGTHKVWVCACNFCPFETGQPVLPGQRPDRATEAAYEHCASKHPKFGYTLTSKEIISSGLSSLDLDHLDVNHMKEDTVPRSRISEAAESGTDTESFSDDEPGEPGDVDEKKGDQFDTVVSWFSDIPELCGGTCKPESAEWPQLADWELPDLLSSSTTGSLPKRQCDRTELPLHCHQDSPLPPEQGEKGCAVTVAMKDFRMAVGRDSHP